MPPLAPDALLALLERRVAAVRKTRPEIETGLVLQERLIRASLTSARAPRMDPFPVPREQAVSRLRDGTPLLHEQPLTVDIHFAADLFSRLVNIVQQEAEPELAARLQALVAAATDARLDPERLFNEAFVQHQDHVFEIAVQAGVDPELLTTLSRQAVAPLLRAYAAHLLPMVELIDDGWKPGYCPICGAWPLLAELRGVELAQFLRCAGCGGAWRSRRVLCPYCTNDDYHTLRMLQVDGEQRFRISVCERCHGYLKVGNAFDPPPAELVALDDLASVHLDVVAIERGYHRPAGSGFAIELGVPEAEWLEELA